MEKKEKKRELNFQQYPVRNLENNEHIWEIFFASGIIKIFFTTEFILIFSSILLVLDDWTKIVNVNEQ